jgi:hypothetical protein
MVSAGRSDRTDIFRDLHAASVHQAIKQVGILNGHLRFALSGLLPQVRGM